MASTRRPAGRWALRWGDLGRALLGLLGGAIGLTVASWIVPDFDVGGFGQALIAALAIFVIGGVLRPVLVVIASLLGWVGAVLIGLFSQTLVIWVVLSADPADETTVWSSFLASWVVSAVSTLFVWVATAGTDDAVTAGLLRGARRKRPADLTDADVPGIVFIQADGVPFPVLEWGVRAGTLPTLARWIRTGSHRMAEWKPKLPATTPASQMGILHGTIEGIPAFRWVDRAEGRVYVANKPADAAAIEAMHSDGRGLLVDDGVSVSNLFTGDAPTAYATMSAVHRTRETRQARLVLSQFLARPGGLARSMSRTFSELGRERFQASRARRRDVRPRVHRGWGFAGERAALSGVLRDLNTNLVADAMLRGRRSVYVDYVDYDAVAHHAGIMQPESLAALEGIDAVLTQLEAVAAVAPRPYHFVVLSDHGQSQGQIFADRYGEDLSSLVRRLSDAEVLAAEYNAEGSGSLNSMIAASSSTDTVMGRALGKASDRLSEQTFGAATKAAETERAQTDAASTEPDQFLVFGSGNLGLIYVAGEPRRLTLQELSGPVPRPGAGPGRPSRASRSPSSTPSTTDRSCWGRTASTGSAKAWSWARIRSRSSGSTPPASCCAPRPCPRRPTST